VRQTVRPVHVHRHGHGHWNGHRYGHMRRLDSIHSDRALWDAAPTDLLARVYVERRNWRGLHDTDGCCERSKEERGQLHAVVVLMSVCLRMLLINIDAYIHRACNREQ
jgi:hypothetical protein